jgi:hypothetical protein
LSESASSQAGAGCPFHAGDKVDLQDWIQRDLLCSAGKREFRFGRYQVASIRNGVDFLREIEIFKPAAREHSRTGLLAILIDGGRTFPRAIDEIEALGVVMQEAGLCSSASAVVDGGTVSVEIELPCPVLGREVVYSFVPVAFCRGAGNPDDALYDPSLSTPFTAINMTSDAFAFALLVRDQCVRLHDCSPYELDDRDVCAKLLEQSVTTWQNMSANTITSYNKRAVCPSRAVHLGDDRRSWMAPHNDPVFAERKKIMHSHEMPIIYCRNLCDSWLAALFDGAPAHIGREGQAGGTLVS